ncbi:non-specific lipid-transfer protein 1-like [Impatiens glandulifera]|uniref:non-specific lipid-transfer protein 1-like n=1 Tax=Impatiens glandulifera TaxID=253017 RepID=UPI001FB1003F|nr:non-specific lipid-transfer protein 1-like [Impatiens glandulifera]
MGSSSGIVCLIVMCMVVSAPHAQAAITCGSVVSAISSCLDYARGGGVIPPICCTGVKNLYRNAATTPDRQTVCTCLKKLTGSATSYPYASEIPGKCGVSIPYKISPSTDCAKLALHLPIYTLYYLYIHTQFVT